jgi:O-methyltransferase
VVRTGGELVKLRDWLLTEHAGTVDADRLAVIADRLGEMVTGGVEGAVVELGCYRGAMAVWMRSVLDMLGDERDIHVYDSFEGLPASGDQDSSYLDDVSLVASPREVRLLHEQWWKASPIIHAGWFRDTLADQLPGHIAFGYLDGDLYASIYESLVYCVSRLSPGGILVIDDYADNERNPKAWNGLPGVKRACDDFFGLPSPVEVVMGDGDLAFGIYQRERAKEPCPASS